MMGRQSRLVSRPDKLWPSVRRARDIDEAAGEEVSSTQRTMMGLVACLLAIALETFAASFDCAKAASAVEKTVCADRKP